MRKCSITPCILNLNFKPQALYSTHQKKKKNPQQTCQTGEDNGKNIWFERDWMFCPQPYELLSETASTPNANSRMVSVKVVPNQSFSVITVTRKTHFPTPGPSVNKLLCTINEKVGISWQKDMSRDASQDMGFTWKHLVRENQKCRHIILQTVGITVCT
jgi:hypothetical protein